MDMVSLHDAEVGDLIAKRNRGTKIGEHVTGIGLYGAVLST